MIRQLLAEKAAEEADRAAQERARRAGARTLTFDASAGGAQGGDAPKRGLLRAPEADAEGLPQARRPRPLPGLEELRPSGAEQLSVAEVIAALEREMGGGVRLATMLATAAGRSAAMVALMAPDSVPAVHTAAE
eukprot:308192-Pleurochrysis_carterae.AAC.1